MLRTFTTNLISTKKSDWEIDWKNYRESYPKKGIDIPKWEANVFLFLGILTTLFPILLAAAYNNLYPMSLDRIYIFCASSIIGAIYCIIVYYHKTRSLKEIEDALLKQWNNVP
jgi:hypothetical protein